MLTPIDIQNRQLKQQMGGYDANETISFLNEVIANYNELYKENQALKEKITSLSEGIQYYKKLEGNSQIDALRAEAQAQAEVTKAKANRELEETRNHVRKLIQSYENYRLQFKKLAETQIDMVESESFSIFVPELDELMNGSPSADSVMDDPGIIPINIGNIGAPDPFVEPPEESAPESPASSSSVVEELPVSIAIPVSSTEPFMAPPADDTEVAPSIDLNVSSSVIGSSENTDSSLEVDLGTGSAINIPISAGAFVSPDDDIQEENAFIDPAANAGVPSAETPMAPTAESPFMDIPGASMDATVPSMDIPMTPVEATVPSMDIPAAPVEATVPSMDIPVAPVEATVPSMDIPAAPIDTTVPSMDIPITPTGEMPGVGTIPNSVEPIASSIDIPIAPSTGTPMTTMDGMLPSMDAANSQAAGTVEASPFIDNGAADPAAFNASQSPFVDATADNNTLMDVPISQNAVPAQANPAMPAMNNAFMDIPAQTPPENNLAENNFVNMDMQGAVPDPAMQQNDFAANPAMQPNPMPQNDFAANPAAATMNNPFVDMPMQTTPENPANMGMQPNDFAANPMSQNDFATNPAMQPNPMATNPAAPAMNNAFVDMASQNPAEANPANMGMQPNPNDFAANPAMQPNPMAANPAAPAMNNAFVDMASQNPAEANPANMGMQPNDFAANPMQQTDFAANPMPQNPMQGNPFMDIPTETPAADASMMNPAQAAGGMLAAEPQPAAPADNNSLMADPFMDVGSMFDSPINDVPAEPEPAPEQNKQSVESFLDINPFNFIDPE